VVDVAARLKHPVTVLVPDKRLFNLGVKHLRSGRGFPPNVRIVNEDPIQFAANAEKEFDYILLNLPEPVSAAEARFLTDEFISSLPRTQKGSVVAVHLPYNTNLAGWSEDVAEILRAVRFALHDSIPAPKAYAGESSGSFIISKRHAVYGEPGEDRVRPERLAGLVTSDLDNSFFDRVKNGARTEHLNAALAGDRGLSETGEQSSAFKPLSLRAALGYHASATGGSSGLFRVVREIKFRHLIVFAVLLGFCWLLLGHRWPVIGAGGAIFSIAFSGMVLEIALMMVFYSVAGTLYFAVGALLAAFMIGYALGCRLTTGLQDAAMSKKILGFVMWACFLTILILGVFGKPLLASKAAPTIVYCGILLLAGSFVGAAYPIIHAALLSASKKPEHRGATAYAFHLLGAALGAILAGFVFMPSIGFSQTCFVLACLLACGVGPFAAGRK